MDQPEPALLTDRSGRTTKVIDPAGHDVEYSYDANGQLKQLKDTKDNATTYDYDADGQVTRKTYADGSYQTMTYNSVGQLIGARDAKGNVANYEYDTAGRMTKIDYPHDTDVTLSYDALGRLSTKTDGLGTTEYSYDTLNRLTSEDGPWENDTISYSYDALGRQTALSINGSTQAEYSYDAFDRLTQVSSGAQNFGYSYNGASSQLTQITLPGGAKTEYSYDAMQHLTQVQSLNGTTNISKFEYSYNTRDVRTSVEKQIGVNTAQTINYTYDTTDQLTKELSTETTPLLNKEYSYDAMGNRITSSASGASTSYTSNNLNQITQTSVGGNQTNITYDANGNMVTEGNKTFGYNDADQLTSVVIPNQKKSEFTYDSDGRKRISKEYTWQNGAWTQTDETRFVYDGMDLVQERGADGTVKASYVRDGNLGGVLSMTNADGTFTYHYDGSGNVVALTDANQNIVAQYSYDAFGNTLSASGAQAEKNPFRFSSKYYDSDTGLYDYGFRHYDSSLGRWINRDPIGESGGLNLYGMVGNDPVNAADPYGLSQDMGGGSGTVRFSFATYIPYGRVNAPLGRVFAGDGRGPSWNSKHYRTQINGIIDLKNHTVHFANPQGGTTHEFTTNWTGKARDYDPGVSGCKRPWGYDINISGGSQNPYYQTRGGNPALAIHHRVTFSFDNNGNYLGAYGDRSGFPSMELWTYRGAAGTPHLAYNFDVRAIGRTNPMWLGNNEQF